MSELDLFDFYKTPFFKFKIDNETQGVLRPLSSSHQYEQKCAVLDMINFWKTSYKKNSYKVSTLCKFLSVL